LARPIKPGLLYFSLDVDIFDDDKFFELSNEYGPLGEVIYLRLLCLIYKNGYYYRFETLDKLSALLIRSIGNKWARDKETVKKIIPFLAEINLLSPELMRENVLTSKSIQRRYQKACERKQSTINEYSLIENTDGLAAIPKNKSNLAENKVSAAKTGVNAAETPVIEYGNPTKEIKEKENILKDIKEKNGTGSENGNSNSADVKLRLAEYVTLTQKELDALMQEFGEEDTAELIRLLNDFKSAKGAVYKNDYCAIKRWVCDKLAEEKEKKTRISKPGRKPRYESKAELDAEKAKELSWDIIEQTLKEKSDSDNNDDT
jgi:hypothetical protein